MEVFQFNQQILKRYGMCLDDKTATAKERVISKVINWSMFWISLCTIAISIEYIVSHFDNTESILYAVMQVAANTASGGGYWTLYPKKYQVSKFIDDIRELVKTR